jgi:hypothetical protein
MSIYKYNTHAKSFLNAASEIKVSEALHLVYTNESFAIFNSVNREIVETGKLPFNAASIPRPEKANDNLKSLTGEMSEVFNRLLAHEKKHIKRSKSVAKLAWPIQKYKQRNHKL